MKKLNNIIILIGVIAFMMSACNKDPQNQIIKNSGDEVYWTQEDVEIQNQILAFQDKVKNNNFKSGEQMTLEDAIWNLEALLNFNYSNPDSSFVNLTVDTTFEFNMPVNNGMVNYENIVDAAFAMETHMIDYLNNMPNSIKFIIAADVSVKPNELKDGTKTITITTGYGSEYIESPSMYIPFGEDDYWLHGFDWGGCESNTSPTSDAAEKIEYKINNPIGVFPPPFDTRIIQIITLEDITGDSYDNPNDAIVDNWLDYLMYYENDEFYPIDGCLEPTEMNFYLQGTLDVIDIELTNIWNSHPNESWEFITLDLEGDLFSYNGVLNYFHRADITYGRRIVITE